MPTTNSPPARAPPIRRGSTAKASILQETPEVISDQVSIASEGPPVTDAPALSLQMQATNSTTSGSKRNKRTPSRGSIPIDKRVRTSAATTRYTTGAPTSANNWNKSSLDFSVAQPPLVLSGEEASELSERRMESARIVLEGILNRPVTKTIQAYKTYFKLWKASLISRLFLSILRYYSSNTPPNPLCITVSFQTFCDQRYNGDSTVSPSKMLEFFEKVVFERKVRKIVDPNAGYSGQIGIAAPGSALRKGKGRKKTLKISASFDRTSDCDNVVHDVELVTSDNENEIENENVAHNDKQDDNNDGDGPGSEDDTEDLSVEEQHSMDATAESLISSITEKNQGMLLHTD